MRFLRMNFPSLLSAVVATFAATVPACGQVQEVVVGVTMTCPYENAIEGGCWSGAYWALLQLDGVKSVEKSANGYNCTARVTPKDKSFPDPELWAREFKKSVDQTYTFRGVELTAAGTAAAPNGNLTLHIPDVSEPIQLQPLEHKLQWNAKKKAPREPEPGERDACSQLAAQLKAAKGGELKVKVTGPLIKSENGYILEVREYFPMTE
ncbi:hypothetical protein [Planctomicrobium piriforme]|uniref:Uncharacterized protein n=1 Tax=Planctomicrobium piriforme TaxID=1576369 RepID=A0A1I3GJ07_9PLAN|nr:hypothetical protein [Planctomicrobium piriforme]SFI23131.1 hypothetical protein SAMN05421753_1075 [Planctomicrobium piriforme]